jgi:uncharacterized membrane protein
MNKFTLTSMLVALTAMGSLLKIPAIITSVSLDAFPALLAAAMLGGPAGAVVGALGHLLSAILGGLPLGAFHVFIALEMALLILLSGYFFQKGKRVSAVVLFIAGNTLAAPLPFIFFIGKAFYIGILPSLFFGSLLNGILALVLIPRLESVLKPLLGCKELGS